MTKQPSTNRNFFKNKGFRFYFLFYLILLFFLASIFLILLHFGLLAYERSRIDRPVKDFLLSLDDDDTLLSLLSEKLDVTGNAYESREKILKDAYLSAFRNGTVTYGPDYDEERKNGDADLPSSGDENGSANIEKDEHIYAVYLNDRKIFSLSLLRKKNEAGFFMDAWELWDTKGYGDGFQILPFDATVMIPEGAELRIGGTKVENENAQKGIRLCIFEKNGISADLYEIRGLYLPPEITVTDKNGQIIPCSEENDRPSTGDGKKSAKFYYYIEEERYYDYTFTVPQGVEVFLNDTLLTKSSCFSYESTEYPKNGEGNRFGVPETILFSARYFSAPPKITASYAGITLKPVPTDDGTHYEFTYPEEALYSLRIETPEGARVFVGDEELPISRAEKAQMTAFGLEKYESKMEHPPITQVYTLKGLLVKPEVKVIYQGKEIEKADQSSQSGADGEQSDFSLLYSYLGSPDATLESEQKAFIEKFVRAYINYVGMGKKNLDGNLETLQSMILRSSAAYKLVNSSYAELIWVTRFSGMEYNYLRTSDYIPLSEDCYRCSAAFSVDISRSGVEKHFESEMTILVIRTNGRFKVVDFRFT